MRPSVAARVLRCGSAARHRGALALTLRPLALMLRPLALMLRPLALSLRPLALTLRPLALALLPLALALAPGCTDKFTEPQVLGGVTVGPEKLERGRGVYVRECSGCHGEKGEGSRATVAGEPAPRDLRIGLYKFTSLPNSGLPTDQDLIETIREGLDGTRMVARHDLDQEKVDDVVQFIKTLSPRWRAEKQLAPPAAVPDPWGPDRRSDALERGFWVYHGVAQCWTCHPAYTDRETIAQMPPPEPEMNGASPKKALQTKGDVSLRTPVETRFGNVLPPDFLGDRVRAAKGPRGLYRAIAVGVGGTPMPAWAGRLSPRDLWAVIYYVQELIRVRGTPGAGRYRRGLPGGFRAVPAEAPAAQPVPVIASPPLPTPTENKGY